jgi:2,4-dienoyl-CoA reductase-like NADH-dependent reductase (Old Yellow Enzyme family)
MTKITDELTIRGNRVKNRIAMLPVMTFSFVGDGGNFYGRQHIDHYAEIAEGGAGLVIVQATHVDGVLSESGKWTPGSQDALKAIAANSKSRGAVAIMQLAAGDGKLDINLPSSEDLRTKQRELLEAALKAHALGYDGVEYHFAHGFYLCKLLDASYNRRTDEFGGSTENRARILTDIIPAIREKTGENFIVAVRMGAYTPTLETAIETARLFEKSGVDLLDISFGMKIPPGPVPDDFTFGPVTHSGYLIKQSVNIPVIGVYDLRSAEQVRTLVERGYADMAGVARAILADPRFPERVLNEQSVNQCRACKECFWFTDHTKCPARG